MKKIIKGILVVLLVLFVFILATWITLVCQIERKELAMKIFFGIVLLLIAFAMGASWGDMRSERIIKRLEFQNRMLKMDVHNLEETLKEKRK